MNTYPDTTPRLSGAELNQNRVIPPLQTGSTLSFGNSALPAANSNGQSSSPYSDPNAYKSIQPYVPLIQKWWAPEDVAKAAHTAFWESTGDPNASGGGATGLFQIQNLAGRPDPSTLTDPETNVKYASYLAYGSPGDFASYKGPPTGVKADFTPWGDNGATYTDPTTGEVKTFGALSKHPYPGDAGVSLPATPLPPDYDSKVQDAQTLIPLLATSQNDQIAAINAFKSDPSNYVQKNRPFELGSEGAFKAMQSGQSDKQIFEAATSPNEQVPTPEANAKLQKMQSDLAATFQQSQQQSLFLNILQGLPQVLNDKSVSFNSVDDLFSYMAKNSTDWGHPFGNDPSSVLTPEQKDYINTTFNHLSPYIKDSGASTQQISEFLAAGRNAIGPSHRVSIAGMSTQDIKLALQAYGGSAPTQLPPGLTLDSLQKAFASNQFASPEAQKAIAQIQGTTKDLVQSWIQQDNQYKAIKLRLLDPTTLPILQDREQSIGQWATEKLGVYSKNVTRPLAALGIMGISGAINLFDSLVPSQLQGIPGVSPATLLPIVGVPLATIGNVDKVTGPLLDKLGISAPTSDLTQKFNQNRQQGQGVWQAAGNSFEQWQANSLIKFFAETAADPLTYVGFGVFPGVTEGVPILGKTVAAVEQGLRVGFENPVISRIGLTTLGASLGYQATGDWKGALGGGLAAGLVPNLHAVNLFTKNQLVDEAILHEGGTVPNAVKALQIENHVIDPTGLSAEQYQNTLKSGIEAVRINPQTAHLSPQGNFVKDLLQKLSPWIDRSEIIGNSNEQPGWLSSLAEPTTSEGINRIIPGEITDHQLTDINREYDLLLDSNRGIRSIPEAADNMARILNLPAEAGPVIADRLTARIESGFTRLNELSAGSDANAIHNNLIDAATKGYRAQVENPLFDNGRFQGYIISLQNKLDPVTRTGIWKFLSTVQNGITRATVNYLGFGATHALEIPFRSAIAGVSPLLNFNLDKEGEAFALHSWNTAFPVQMRSHANTLGDMVAAVGKDAPISDSLISKDKNFFIHIKDWVSPNGAISNIYNNTKGNAYLHFIPDEVARAAPEAYLGTKSSIDRIMGNLTDTSLTPTQLEGIRTQLFAYSLRPDASELLRNLAGDIPAIEKRAFVGKAQEALDQYTEIEQPYKNYILRSLQRGDYTPETIDMVKGSLLEHEIAKSSIYSQELKDFSQKFVNSLTSSSKTGKDVTKLVGQLNDIREATASATSDILSSATERAHTIKGDAATTQHWDRANKALSDYVSSSTDSLTQMIDALKTQATSLPTDTQNVVNSALDSLNERITLINNTRSASDKVITDYIANNGGKRPVTSAAWDNINAQRKAIWDQHWLDEGRLLKKYNTLTSSFENHLTSLPSATNGLTVRHVAQFYHTSGDELASSLVELQGIMRREQFIGTIAGDAEAAAIKSGTTASALGWTDEAIGNLYDQIRVRLNTNPIDSPTLIMAKQQLDSIRQDIDALQLSHNFSQSTKDSLASAYNSHADYMTQHPFDQADITKAYEQAHLRFSQNFIDYSHENVFDAAMKGIYPFWMHQAQRWPWVFNTVLSHPGIGTFLGRYQDYTDKGYIHFPGSDMAFNLLRGNSLMGGFGGLVSQFPANYESGVLGKVGLAYDQMGKAGFYPGFWATLPLNLLKVTDFSLPAPIDTAISAAGQISPEVLKMRDYLFPSRYRDYYTSELVSSAAEAQGLDTNGETVRRHINAGIATPDEQALWTAAQKKMARYQILFDQTGIFKLDPEAKRAASLEASNALYKLTGVTPTQQDAITSRLGSSGLRLTDVLPLDPASSKQVYELSKFKYWSGLSTALQPPELQQTMDKINEYWARVINLSDMAKSGGIKDSKGNAMPSLDSLDADFRSGKITAKEFLTQQSGIKTAQQFMASQIASEPEFQGVPITLEQRTQWAQDHNSTVPVDHPAKEILNLYYSLAPKDDPTTGLPNWEDYFASVDGLLNVLPPDKKSYLQDYIERTWTPTQKLYKQSSDSYLRPYNNIREGILQSIDPAQKDFINRYAKVDAATIDSLPTDQAQLLKDYNSAVSRAEQRYRELSPETDAWLYYWGKSGSLLTEAARSVYNQLVHTYPGPAPMTQPIKEKKNIPEPLP